MDIKNGLWCIFTVRLIFPAEKNQSEADWLSAVTLLKMGKNIINCELMVGW